MDNQDWFPIGWTGWIFLKSKWLWRVFSNSSKASILLHSAFFIVQLSHPYMTTGKTIALTRWTFVGKVTSLLFNSCLESNPVPSRDAQTAQKTLVHTRTQRPHGDWERTVFEHLLWRYSSAVDYHRGRGSGRIRHGYGLSPLGGGRD